MAVVALEGVYTKSPHATRNQQRSLVLATAITWLGTGLPFKCKCMAMNTSTSLLLHNDHCLVAVNRIYRCEGGCCSSCYVLPHPLLKVLPG